MYFNIRYLSVALVCVFTGVVTFLYPDSVELPLVYLGLFTFLVSTIGVELATRVLSTPIERSIVWVAPFDLFAFAVLGAAYHAFEDPMYVAFLTLPVVYALIIRRKATWWVGVASAVAYLLQHVPFLQTDHPLTLAILLIKATMIAYVAYVTASAVARQTEHEEQIGQATEEKQRLNEQLQRRLSELQAVSQITEIIHSSLDFDRVGPLVLEVLTKVINVPACALFVIDKRKAETLFSASVGMAGTNMKFRAIGGFDEGFELSDDHFACMSIMDHHQMMVVFCADSEVIEALSDEDRLVLQAVSSELVVAVENSQLYKLTKRLAITDELTGLYNYRYLQQRLDEEIERARRYSKDLSLLMLDVDDFKHFNDKHGHIAGDRALADLGRSLRKSVREVDVVCRYGGEEFSVVLPETDAAGAFVVAEKIRETIARFDFADADHARTAHLTVSIGLATFPAHAPDKEALLKMADDALYQAKSGGKDRVRSPMMRRSRASTRPATDGEG